jgi:hypothetical protein
VYIDSSYVKHKIPVKPIYVTVHNLNTVVSGKACAWRALGMIPSVQKSATLQNDDTWRKDRRLRLHHACIAKVAEMINKLVQRTSICCARTVRYIPLLCADGQVHACAY